MDKARRVFGVVTVVVALHAAAQTAAPTIPKDETKGFATLTEAELRTDLTYIAGDRMMGRMSLQPGDEAAIDWVARAFKAAGLKPAAVDAKGMPSYRQDFALVEYRPDRAGSSVTLTRDGTETVFHAPQAFGAFKRAVDLSAPVVFAGFGITAPELGYDDYKGLNARGKIVLVFDHEPQEDNAQSIFNGTGNTRYATTRVKLLNAQAHGAVALVVVAEPNRKHLTNAERAAKIGGSIVRAVPLPLEAIADDEITIPAVTVLDPVAAELLATTGTTGSALQAAIDKDLTPQGRALPDTTLRLHLLNVKERTGVTSNVAGLLEGSDPALKAETILISGHHDHDGSAACAAGKGGVDEQGRGTPAGADCLDIWHGADDNGSGTVGVVALAKAFGSNGHARPKRSVMFVVFASEERGLLGSYWMAAHPLRPLATTRAMINFDMIGRDEKASPQTDGLIEIPVDTSNRLNLIGAFYSPSYDRVVKEEDKLVGLTLDDRFDHESALNVFFRSDQFPFVLHNVPAFWWFTGFHPDYHHTTDTVEKIDFVKMRKILQLAYLTAWRFGDDAKTPVFIANPMPSVAGTQGGTEGAR
jgi:hypothetical protein